jgi:phage terminase large subunit-like protein
VVDGEIIAGPHVRDACARHLRDLVEGPKRGLKWDVSKAARVTGFFRDALKLDGGESPIPFELIPWQQFVIGSLFGWLAPDGYRRFRKAFIETGKGSGKSPLAAGVGLYMMMADGERQAEVYSAAVDKEQAGILFRDAVSMTKLSPAIDGRVVRSGGAGREFNIAYLATASFFRPISSESTGRGKSGYRPHCVLLDEIHEHPTNAMVEFMGAGTKGRRQALIFMITNSGVDRTSVCFEYHTYGTRAAKGEIQDDSFFSYICAVDEGEDPIVDEPDPQLGYPRSWARTNPSTGVTFRPPYLEKQVREAKGMPSKESIVRRLNFCQWVDAANPWIDSDRWEAVQVESINSGGPCALGLDLSKRRDLTAAARAVWADDGVLEIECKFWTPAETIEERERIDRVPYRTWVDQGHLIAVPGRSIDYAYVVRDLVEWLKECSDLAFDQWRISDFLGALDDEGVDAFDYDSEGQTGDGIRLVRHGQGYTGGASDTVLWMPRSIDQLEAAVINGTVRIKRNPVLTYCSASAVVEQDAAANKKWEKRKSTGRIDGIVAVCMADAVARWSLDHQPVGWLIT